MEKEEFEREYLGIDKESIKNILIPIEQKISDVSRDIGPGRNTAEIVDADFELMTEVVLQGYKKRPQFMRGGDHNIAFMASLAMVSTAWLFFILRAKSLNNVRYSEEQREFFARAFNLHRAYHVALMKKSADLGEVYDAEGRWGVPDCVADPNGASNGNNSLRAE